MWLALSKCGWQALLCSKTCLFHKTLVRNGRMLLLRRLRAHEPSGCSSATCIWPMRPELSCLLEGESLRRQPVQVLRAQKEISVIFVRKIIAFTQPKSRSVTDPAAPLSFFHSPDSDMVLWREHKYTSLDFFVYPFGKVLVLVQCIPIWFLFEYLFQKTHPYCSTVQPIAMKRNNNTILKDRSGILSAILGSNLSLKGFYTSSKKYFLPVSQ